MEVDSIMIFSNNNKKFFSHGDKPYRFRTLPEFMRLSRMDDTFPWCDDSRFGNSDTANEFHRLLPDNCGLNAAASYLEGDINNCTQLHLWLWVKDNEISEALIGDWSIKSVVCGEPYFDEIFSCLISAAERFDPDKADVLTGFYERQKNSDSILTYISINSYERAYKEICNNVIAERITEKLKIGFPQYPHLECFACAPGSLKQFSGGLLLLFFTPDDQKAAEKNGDLEKIFAICRKTAEGADLRRLYSSEDMTPSVDNRRNFTRDELFIISRTK